MMNQSYNQPSCRYARNMDSCMQAQSCPKPLPIPSCPCEQMTKEQLLEWISLTKFACVDANLYLDTHPDDTAAIQYFQEHNRLYQKAMNEYARVYGPLTVSHAQHCSSYWDWVNQPWPCQ